MLYIICSPIGNLNDFSLRSINTLKEVDNIFAEDTRVAAKLLQHFDIQKKTKPFHEHNENQASEEIIQLLKSGTKRYHLLIWGWILNLFHSCRESIN